MGLVRLAVCVSGVYATFLLWAIAQERLVSRPFPSTHHPVRLQPPTPDRSHRGDPFPSPIFLNYTQSLFSTLASLLYLLLTRAPLGFSHLAKSVRDARPVPVVKDTPLLLQNDKMNGGGGGDVFSDTDSDEKARVEAKKAAERVEERGKRVAWRKTLPALLVQVSLCQTVAGPVGFLALRHISYPTMVLGKSCKLVPVLMLNVLLYRRRVAPHKYLVVLLVTLGISLFMLLGDASSGKKKAKAGADSATGLFFLVLNLLIDGLTNSTQDQIFTSYPAFTGQQMMFHMSLLTQLLLLPFILLPLPVQPLSLLSHLPLPFLPRLLPHLQNAPILLAQPAAFQALSFLQTHPTAIGPLLQYAALGGLGQLFIFETIQHFGSLTLVMVTVTRKLFTMLLSVVVFEHRLSSGQWLAVGVVFAGIGTEAGFKRREVVRRARRD